MSPPPIEIGQRAPAERGKPSASPLKVCLCRTPVKHLQRGCELIDRCPTKAHLQRTVHWAGPAQLELVSTSRGGVNCSTGVRHRHTFSALALGLPRSAGARWHLQRGCEVFDRCPTKA